MSCGEVVVAIEVKSGRRPTSLPGLVAFAKECRVTRQLLVGAQGMSLEEFLRIPPATWVAGGLA